uniref:hypothetical protein n=1 Tax=Streptomyces corallincola TaxID=2851888 RepID=UPI001FE70618|nr:hypothetical protein [Streptomyces corallincola]
MLYVKVLLAVVVLLLAASGIAALTRGWVLPRNRHLIRSTRLYGAGQLLMAGAIGCQLYFGAFRGDSTWTLVGALLLLIAFGVLLRAQSGTDRTDHAGSPGQ